MVPVFVNPQILFLKIPGSHSQGLRQSLDVVLIKDGTRCLAAIGTRKAISLLEYVVVHTMENVIHFTRIYFLEPGEELPVLLFLVSGLQFELFCIHVSGLWCANIGKENGSPSSARRRKIYPISSYTIQPFHQLPWAYATCHQLRWA